MTSRFRAITLLLPALALSLGMAAYGQDPPARGPHRGPLEARKVPPTEAAPAAPSVPSTGPAATTQQSVMTPAAKPPVPTATTNKANSAKTKSAAKKNKKGTPPEQAEAPLPPPPPRPEQLPPTRPTVTYSNGQLSILANNSTMSDVLNSVRTQTGAQFEMAGVSNNDRVYAKLGPGAPKDILAALLDGSRFNFAILGSPTDAAAVARVVLMPKAGGATAPTTTVAQNPVPRQVQRPNPDEASDEEGQPEEAPAEEQPVEQAQPEQPQQEQQQQQPGQVKTPEQLLQELQQMQQQQQQQQNPNAQPQQQPQQQPPQIPDREIPDDQNPQ
jgi:hypothetical protein